MGFSCTTSRNAGLFKLAGFSVFVFLIASLLWFLGRSVLDVAQTTCRRLWPFKLVFLASVFAIVFVFASAYDFAIVLALEFAFAFFKLHFRLCACRLHLKVLSKGPARKRRDACEVACRNVYF